ncbi:coumaroyl-CoA:anthocyanidin 3-O-glucoside-6''-O-coumaroyltransferase 1 [Cajanus cajan]|uniref:Anthocyanin 5-aromatic acyltransferase n=1 Tax=Cajanus cajan TaxID=3821 RepID=A0A151RLM9_CAJCA|nr:coumaroyl-CoA:anthocyanidin 3-O-glucoside-6''-O-coumaroyltransferase 1 [Cajanus cajan]KYP43449.1 Anthocyanin 5-aromatic acyltransferase [Cajanus cajan]
MAEATTNKLVEKSQVAPVTTKTTSLPLSFLDLTYTGSRYYVRRQFFYDFPHPTHIFYETKLPSLKHTLSLTLQHFYPLAGNLLCPPPPHKPFIRCTDHDSVTLTVTESQADFNLLSSNHPKSLKDLGKLVPNLSCTTVPNDTFVSPLLALQITVFPNCGLCISITYCHAIMDGRCCCYFMKCWSSICRSGGVDLTLLEISPPCFDREVLRDTKGLEAIFLRDYFEARSTWKVGPIPKHGIDDEGYVKATITFGRDDIEAMKKWALNQWKKDDKFQAPQYLSKFVVTSAFLWVSLVKAKYRNDNEEEQVEMIEDYFRFAADCRDRLEYPIPATYFGNCLARCYVGLKRKDLKGEGGFVNAVKAIVRTIADMKTEPLKGAENWKELFIKTFLPGRLVLVTGSPKFNVYETDFGFGKPTKVDVAHSSMFLSFVESRDKEGGLEVGLVFRSEEFEYYITVIEQGLVTLKS